MSILQQARFAITVNHLCDLPDSNLSEVAFAGRSNAGKSTAINVLCGQKRLAFSSKTPGRTQHINFFGIPHTTSLNISLGAANAPAAYLVDLPGYGYARVGEAVREHWRKILSGYIQKRSQLKGLVLMMDARRPFTELDHQMLDWLVPTSKPLHILLTKADKLTRSEATLTLANTRQMLAVYQKQYPPTVELSVQLFSALKRTGLEEATEKIGGWLDLI